MKKYLLFALVLIFISCGHEKRHTEEIDFSKNEKTQNIEIAPDVSSYSIRKSQDLIQHLYEQALDKDKQLSLLDDKIRGIRVAKKDSLIEYNEFVNYNDMYYVEANRYVSSIRDSIKRKAVKKILLDSKSRFKNAISLFEAKSKMSDDLEEELDDQYTLMKILISESLISSYQEKMPNVESIKGLNNQYESIVSGTEKYTKPIN